MCHFGILLTWASQEGNPLHKEREVEYFPLLLVGGGHRLQEWEAFCIRVFSVNKISGHIWVKLYKMMYCWWCYYCCYIVPFFYIPFFYKRFISNNNHSYTELYPVKIYKLAAHYIINIKIRLTVKKVQVQ